MKGGGAKTNAMEDESDDRDDSISRRHKIQTIRRIRSCKK
jgi:hypothetical protein